MGVKNMRAICPNCGGKIHTQPKGFLGSIALGATGPLVRTGTQCQLCGAALTGQVTMENYAVLIVDSPPRAISSERCTAMAAGRQCSKTQGHDGPHDVSKKAIRRWA